MSAAWNSLTKSAQVVCRVLTRAIPVVTGEVWTMSRTSLVMSETSVPSSLDSVNEALKTFILSVPQAHPADFAGITASARPKTHPLPYGEPPLEVKPPGTRPRSGLARVEQVAEAVTEQVQAEHGQCNRGAGEHREPGIEREEVLGLLQHEPPRWLW